MKHTRVVSTKCTPGFACRAFSDTTLVCFIVNEHTTKCSRYKNIVSEMAAISSKGDELKCTYPRFRSDGGPTTRHTAHSQPAR